MTDQNDPGRDLAIVGMACRFPGAADYEAFWANLRSGKQSVSERFYARPEMHVSPSSEAGRAGAERGGWLDDIGRFDNAFFDISASEAAQLDPQQRILLEETWHCIEDSGIPLRTLQNSVVFTFVGVMALDHLMLVSADRQQLELHHQLGNYACGASNRLSHRLGLEGKSVTLDTACASALCSVNEAKIALRARHCDYAIAAAAKVLCHPFQRESFRRARVLSERGESRPFDACADGFVQGEGVGVLLLQRLDDALDSGAHVHAVIKGTAVNHLGARARQVSWPNVGAQAGVVKAALDDAGVHPDTLGYIEAHAVGSSIGDAVELAALNRAFREQTERVGFCRIGSVKGNIGHLESAAGMSGLIKVVLMLRERELPPAPRPIDPGPLVDFEPTPFRLALRREAWQPLADIALRAGVNAFGFTGSNAHVVLEAAPAAAGVEHGAQDDARALPLPFVFSARTATALEALLAKWRDFIETAAFSSQRLADICLTLALGREAAPHRWACVASSAADLKRQLCAALPRSSSSSGLHVHFGAIATTAPEQARRDVQRLPGLEQRVRVFETSAGLLSGASTDAERGAEWARQIGFSLDCAIFEWLLALGLKVEGVSFQGDGVFAALVATKMLGFQTALAWLKAERANQRLELMAPTSALHDPVTGAIIAPNRPLRVELERELAACAISEQLLAARVSFSGRLYETQYAYRRSILEWQRCFRAQGFDVGQLTSSPAQAIEFCTGSERRRVLVAMVVEGALRAFLGKWDLPDPAPIPDPHFIALYGLIERARLEREQVFAWLARPSQLPPESQPVSRPFGDGSSWLREALATRAGAPAVAPGCEVIEVRQVLLPHVQGAPFRAAQLSSFTRWWTVGATIDWGVVLGPEPYRKVSLPTYPFEGGRHLRPELSARSDARCSEDAGEERRPRGTVSPAAQDLSALSELQLTELFERLHVAPHASGLGR